MNPSQQPPGSVPRPLEPRGFFTGVQIRPIIVGAVADYIVTNVVILLYLFVYYIQDPFEKGGSPEEAIEKALMEMISSQEGILSLLAIGALCTLLGGYIAGRLAKGEEVKHGALVGAVSLIVGILQATVAGQDSPVAGWYELLGYVLAIPAGALGGSFAQGKAKLSIPGSSRKFHL
jgi:putative membrane protein (TIGR04086 family)